MARRDRIDLNPFPAHSTAIDRVRLSSAAFDAE